MDISPHMKQDETPENFEAQASHLHQSRLVKSTLGGNRLSSMLVGPGAAMIFSCSMWAHREAIVSEWSASVDRS